MLSACEAASSCEAVHNQLHEQAYLVIRQSMQHYGLHLGRRQCAIHVANQMKAGHPK